MDRGAWRATVPGVARVRYDLVTEPPLGLRLSRIPLGFVSSYTIYLTMKMCINRYLWRCTGISKKVINLPIR